MLMVLVMGFAKNSRIASCTRIDESLRENVSRSGQKFLAPAENIEVPTDFFIVAYHFVICRVSILHKEIRFRARTFAFFTSAAFIGGPVFRRASARPFIYTQGHFPDTRDADSRSQRPALKRHCTGCRP